MTQQKTRTYPTPLQQTIKRDLDREQRRLRKHRPIQQTLTNTLAHPHTLARPHTPTLVLVLVLVLVEDHAAQRTLQHTIKPFAHHIQRIPEHRRDTIQLAAHTHTLRTLPRKQHHDTTTINSTTPHNTPTNTTPSQHTQPIQQPLTPNTHHHTTILEHRPTQQRKTNINHTQTRISTNTLQQPASLTTQPPHTPTRQQPRQHNTIPKHNTTSISSTSVKTIQLARHPTNTNGVSDNTVRLARHP